MNAEVKSSQLNLRLAPALKAEAERAAARDHRSLTSLIEKLLADHLRDRVTLDAWHVQARSSFDELLLKRSPSSLGPRTYRELSFAIRTSDGQALRPQDLLPILQSLPNGMRGIFTSTTLFHAYTRHELAPYFTQDSLSASTGDLGEIFESAVFPDVSKLETIDFWRIAPKGFGSHIRPYNEDRESMRNVGLVPGKWFWPFSHIRDLYELILDAYLLSGQFSNAETVEFRCEWWGLHDREIADAEPGISWTPGKVARMDHCVTRGEWEKENLRRTPEVVSVLLAPVMRFFDPTFDCSADFIGGQTERFRRF